MMQGGARLPIPPTLLGKCFSQADVGQVRWDPGFELDGSLPSRVVRGLRVGSRAAKAGLQDGMQIRGLSVYRGDVTKEIDLRVRAAGDTVDRHVIYLPVSDVSENGHCHRDQAGLQGAVNGVQVHHCRPERSEGPALAVVVFS